jgi:hypothetical protein
MGRMADPTAAQALYDAIKGFMSTSTPRPHPWWYDTLKDFQPSVAAAIALIAAALAYWSATAKIRSDRMTAAADRIERKAGVLLRLRSGVEVIAANYETARENMAAVIQKNIDLPDDAFIGWVDVQMKTFNDELNEAWTQLTFLPLDAHRPLQFIRVMCHNLELARARLDDASQLRKKTLIAFDRNCKNICEQAGALIDVLDKELDKINYSTIL